MNRSHHQSGGTLKLQNKQVSSGSQSGATLSKFKDQCSIASATLAHNQLKKSIIKATNHDNCPPKEKHMKS